jgi:uncharacterized protein (DUF58 family)
VIPTRRLAVVVALVALGVAFLPGPWAWMGFAGGNLIVAALVFADWRLAAGPGTIQVTRACQGKLSLAADNEVKLTVANAGSARARVSVRDTPPPAFGVAASRTTLDMDGWGEKEHAYSVRPLARGVYRFGDLWVRTPGPLGLAARQFAIPAACEVRVCPNIRAIDQYALLARRGALYEMGVRAPQFRGGGTEFESLREYQADDDYSSIDWKATARRHRPITQVYEPDRSQTLMLAIDAGRLMAPRVDGVSKLDHAINAALMMAYVGTSGDDLVGLVVFGRDVQTYLPPRKGRSQFLAILDALYRVEGEPVAEPDYARALRYVATRTSRRSLVVVFSDLAGVEASRRLLGVLSGLMPHHLPLLVTMRDREVEAILSQAPKRAEDAYRQAVAARLLSDRAQAQRALVDRGAMVLDAVPGELSVGAVNAYLEVKARGRL